MLIERQLENDFIAELKSMPELSASQVVGSREVAAAGDTKSEEDTKATIVAVACGFRQNDAFSLSPISMPMSITIMTRSELDPTSEYHDAVVESIADLLSRWHKYGDEMADALTSEKFLAGELRMDGGTNRVYDSMNSTWSETLTFTIRGAEKFTPPLRMSTILKYSDGRNVELDIQGELGRDSIPDIEYISELDIGNAVTSIGSSTFSGCSGLTSVTIPNSVTSIAEGAFSWCTKLMSVTIGNGVMSIGKYAFRQCTNLTSVTLPSSVTSIGDGAFDGCSGLTSVTIPDSVTSIGEAAFSGCSGLMSFVVSDGNPNYKSVNGLLLSKDGKLLVAGVNGNVTIPDSVMSIGNLAFLGCGGLASVTIGNGVILIDADAFYGCTSVTDVYCYPNPANLTWDEDAKDDFKTDGSTRCHVKAEYLAAYQSKFGNEVNVTFIGDLS